MLSICASDHTGIEYGHDRNPQSRTFPKRTRVRDVFCKKHVCEKHAGTYANAFAPFPRAHGVGMA